MMLRRLSTLFLVFLALAFVASAPGCKKVQRLLPPKTIENPEAGTPEAIVQEAIKAAMTKDEAEGWKHFRSLLHSSELESPASEKNWRQMNFATFRRKVPLFLEDPSKPVYKMQYYEETADGMYKVFVINSKSDVPTPCGVKRDANNNDEWRIKMCSL